MPFLWIVLLFSAAGVVLADYNISVPVSDPNVTFTGPNWWPEKSGGDCSPTPGKYTGAPGEQVTLLFTGTAVYVKSSVGHGYSLVIATLDNSSYNIDPTQVPTLPACIVLFARSGLSDTTHNLTLMNNGPASHMQLQIADFLVTRQGDAPSNAASSTATSLTSFLSIPTESPTHSPSSDSPSPMATSSVTSSRQSGLSTNEKIALGLGLPGAIAALFTIWSCLMKSGSRLAPTIIKSGESGEEIDQLCEV